MMRRVLGLKNLSTQVRVPIFYGSVLPKPVRVRYLTVPIRFYTSVILRILLVFLHL